MCKKCSFWEDWQPLSRHLSAHILAYHIEAHREVKLHHEIQKIIFKPCSGRFSPSSEANEEQDVGDVLLSLA